MASSSQPRVKDKAVVDKGAVSIRFRIVNELLPSGTMSQRRSQVADEGVPAAYGPYRAEISLGGGEPRRPLKRKAGAGGNAVL